MARSKVIIITHEFPPFYGGAGVYCEELATALRRTGRTVEVWSPRRPGSLRLRHLVPFAWRVWCRREELRDCTVILGSRGAHMIFMVIPFKTAKLVSLLYGSELLRYGRRLRSLLNRVQGVIVSSKFAGTLVPGGIKTVVALPAPCTAAMQSVTDIKPHTGIRILTLARLHPRKGQIEVAQALALLPAEYRKMVTYQVGGAGQLVYLHQIERACRTSGVAFEYLGPIPPEKLAATYAQCDIFVMTSRSLRHSVEGFGIAFLEAGFHSKPVIGYRSGGESEAVVTGETGWLVAEADIPAVADKITQLIANPSLREKIGEQGREHVRQFSWDHTAGIIAAAID